MWRLIAKLLGLPKEQLNVGSSGQGEQASPPPSESSGTPEDNHAPTQLAAEPPPQATPDQDEIRPVRLSFPVPAPSRNGTHTHAQH